MTISAAFVLEVRTAGSDLNGGGFKAGATGTDYSQQNAKNTVGSNISTTDAVANGTTTLTSATAAFTAAIVGNLIYLAGGSGSLAGVWREVTVFTNATTVTLDATVAAGTGITLNIGGALASPGQASAIRVAGNTVWIKSGTYSITSASTNIAGGCVSDAVGGAGKTWEGYGTTRGDLGTAPILQASGISTATLFTVTAGGTPGFIIRNITVDGASLTSIQGFSLQRRGAEYKLLAKNCTNIGINAVANNFLLACSATNITGGTAAIVCGSSMFCEAYSNTVHGFNIVATTSMLSYCLAYNNSGATSDGFNTTSSNDYLVNCVAYSNGRDGFRLGNGEAVACVNCIAESNVGTGFNATSAAIGAAFYLFNCAVYNNGTNIATNITAPQIGTVTGTASFFTNAAGNDFSLNNTASAGAAARATGIPGLFPRGTTTGYLDIGAAQHRDLGGLKVHPGMSGGMNG